MIDEAALSALKDELFDAYSESMKRAQDAKNRAVEVENKFEQCKASKADCREAVIEERAARDAMFDAWHKYTAAVETIRLLLARAGEGSRHL